MKTLINRMQDAVRARAAYRRTVSEIQAMHRDVALDFDIDRADAKRIARQAVYGR